MTIPLRLNEEIKKLFLDSFFKSRSSDSNQKTNNSKIGSNTTKIAYDEIKISRFELIINIIRNFFWIPNGDTPPPSLRGTIFIAVSSFTAGIALAILCYSCNFSICSDFLCQKIPKSNLIFASIILTIPSLYVFWICFCCWRRIEGYDWWMIPQW